MSRPFRPTACGSGIISVLVAWVLFLGALDLHSPTLSADLVASPTPVFCNAGNTGEGLHIEACDGRLTPDHVPALLELKRLKRDSLPAESFGIVSPRIVVRRIEPSQRAHAPTGPPRPLHPVRAPPQV